MKLPDFTNDAALNELRLKMGAELRPYSPPKGRAPLTADEVEALATKGIEIPLREIGILNDGTFTYKGKRVAVYIRDIASYHSDYSLPKYHLAMCETLLTMKGEGRYEKRYVVAARDDGRFRIQKIEGNRVVSRTDEELLVCQNCLHGLRYKNFDKNKRRSEKEEFIQEFSIKQFFEEYERSPIWAQPHYDSDHAPSNVYSVDFYEIAVRIKEQRRFRCEQCRKDLSNPLDRKFLHAHHKDADKSDNSPSNIALLCIYCHAKEFQHSHVRDMPAYKEFVERFII